MLSIVVAGQQGLGQSVSPPPPPPASVPQSSAPGAPAIRVATRLVQVAVIVQDEHGDPVTGLTKDDFELLDQGKLQRISEFSILAAPNTALSVIQAASSTPVQRNIFSNRVNTPADVAPQVSVILLDLGNSAILDMTWACGKVLKFLEGMHPQDTVAILELGDELRVLHGFTNDANALMASLSTSSKKESDAKNASKFEGNSTVRDAGAQQRFNALERERVATITGTRAVSTSRALIEIAHTLAGVRGRKNLIWISSAFPPVVVRNLGHTRVPENFEGDITRATRALTDANVAVYPVDPRGLPDAIYMGLSAPSGLKPLPEADYATMDEIAELTGGKSSYHTNDIEGSIRRAVDDSRVTYMLGYYPDHSQWDGEFREIKVKVDRKGSEVRYRRGYFATQNAAPTDQKLHGQLLLAAASAPLESTLLGIKVELLPGNSAQSQIMKARLTVDLQDVALNFGGDRRTGSIDFFYAEVNAKREVLASKTQALSLNFNDASYKKTMKDGVRILCNFPVKPGAEMIRVVALDENSGATGSVTIPISAMGMNGGAK